MDVVSAKSNGQFIKGLKIEELKQEIIKFSEGQEGVFWGQDAILGTGGIIEILEEHPYLAIFAHNQFTDKDGQAPYYINKVIEEHFPAGNIEKCHATIDRFIDQKFAMVLLIDVVERFPALASYIIEKSAKLEEPEHVKHEAELHEGSIGKLHKILDLYDAFNIVSAPALERIKEVVYEQNKQLFMPFSSQLDKGLSAGQEEEYRDLFMRIDGAKLLGSKNVQPIFEAAVKESAAFSNFSKVPEENKQEAYEEYKQAKQVKADLVDNFTL